MLVFGVYIPNNTYMFTLFYRANIGPRHISSFLGIWTCHFENLVGHVLLYFFDESFEYCFHQCFQLKRGKEVLMNMWIYLILVASNRPFDLSREPYPAATSHGCHCVGRIPGNLADTFIWESKVPPPKATPSNK